MTSLTLDQMCFLIAVYGDISEDNRDRWQRGGMVSQKTVDFVMHLTGYRPVTGSVIVKRKRRRKVACL